MANMADEVSLKSQAKAWGAVFSALSEVNPEWWQREGCALDNAVAFIKHLGTTATPFPKGPEILDRDATWKIVGVPLKTVISYLQSLPPEAMIMQDNEDSSHLELIVIKH